MDILNILQMLLAFLLTIGILVTIHEWGHYWVAKKLGVKVLRFSIGFGTPIWSRRYGPDQTEFAIAAIPLGGYVSMLGEYDDNINPAESHRAFNKQPVWVRASIAAAGPLVNLIFAILIFTVMYMGGVTGLKPLVGELAPDSIAARAGLESGYEIKAVEDRAVMSWQSVVQTTLQARLNSETVKYTILDERGYEKTVTLNLTDVSVDDFNQGGFFSKTGLTPLRPDFPAIVDQVLPDSPAVDAGLQTGDEVISADGTALKGWYDWTNYVRKRPDQTMEIQVVRNEKTISLQLTPMDKDGVGFVGIGVKAPESGIPSDYLAVERYGIIAAFQQGVVKFWDITTLTLQIFVRMITLEVSLENISGPITIAQFAGYTFSDGWVTFCSFLGLVSISLGIINLLPIPLLDGGHLLVYALEAIKGRPLSEKTLFFMQRVGIMFVAMLMGLAIFNDINRLFW